MLFGVTMRRVGVGAGLVLVWWLVAFLPSTRQVAGTPLEFAAILPLYPSAWATLLVWTAVAGAVVGLVLWRTGGTWVDVAAVVVASAVLVGVIGWVWFDRHLPEEGYYLRDDRVVAFGLGLYVLGATVGLALGALAVRGLPTAVPALVVVAWAAGTWLSSLFGADPLALADTVAGRPWSWWFGLLAVAATGVVAGRIRAWVWAVLGGALVMLAQVASISLSNVSVLIRPPIAAELVDEAWARVTGILPVWLRTSYPWEPLIALAIGVVVGLVLRSQRRGEEPVSTQ